MAVKNVILTILMSLYFSMIDMHLAFHDDPKVEGGYCKKPISCDCPFKITKLVRLSE
jgi:hypothetical protein